MNINWLIERHIDDFFSYYKKTKSKINSNQSFFSSVSCFPQGLRHRPEIWSTPWSSPLSSWSGRHHQTRAAGWIWPTVWVASGVCWGSASRAVPALASCPSRWAWRRGRWRWSIFFQTPTTPSLWKPSTGCRSCCPTRGSSPRSTCPPASLVSLSVFIVHRRFITQWLLLHK